MRNRTTTRNMRHQTRPALLAAIIVVGACKFPPPWAEGFGGAGADEIDSASASVAGDALVGGTFTEDFTMGSVLLDDEAGTDGLVARVSMTTGTVAWAKSVSGARTENVAGASVMGSEVVIAGTLGGPARVGSLSLTPSGPAVYTARLRLSDGQTISAHAYDGSVDGMRSTVPQGTIVMTGGFAAPIDFGIGVADHGPNLDPDVLLARIIP